MIDPPRLDGWKAYCDSCECHRTVHLCAERDMENGERYFEYVCDECFSILLSIHRANPLERNPRPSREVMKKALLLDSRRQTREPLRGVPGQYAPILQKPEHAIEVQAMCAGLAIWMKPAIIRPRTPVYVPLAPPGVICCQDRAPVEALPVQPGVDQLRRGSQLVAVV